MKNRFTERAERLRKAELRPLQLPRGPVTLHVIIDKQLAPSENEDNGISKAAIGVEVTCIDDSHAYNLSGIPFPCAIEQEEIMSKYGNTLVGRRAQLCLPSFPSLRAGRIINIEGPLYAMEESDEETDNAKGFLTKQRSLNAGM